MLYELEFNPTKHRSIVTGCSYILTVITLFLIYSGLRQYQLWYRRSKQKAHAVGKFNSPILSRTYRWGRWLNHSVRIPLLSPNIDAKSLLYILLLIVFNAVFILEIPIPVYTQQRLPFVNFYYAGLRCAILGVANISLAITLATRNSIIKLISTKSFDEVMPLHRWHATMGLTEIAIHVSTQLYGHFPLFQTGTFFIAENGDLISGFMATIGLLCIFLGSRDYIRRRYFEVFYISHVFGILLFIGAGFTHQYAVIIFVAPSVFLYFSDRIIRAVRTWTSPTKIIDVSAFSQKDITQIVFAKDGLYTKAHPGQFVFVSLNDGTRLSRFVNFFNWHPFTLSEVFYRNVSEVLDHDKETATTTSHHYNDIDSEIGKRTSVVKKEDGPLKASVHIKSLGNMTRRLHCQASNEPQRLKMRIDGPYGSTATALEMNQVVTFFEAGIGITPSLTMFRDLVEKCAHDPLMVHTTHIYFIWVTASIEIAQIFIPQLLQSVHIANGAVNPPKITFQLYLTTRLPMGIYENPLPHCDVIQGRPNSLDIVSRIDDDHLNSSIAAQVCGPADFMREVNNSCNARGWRVRQETFEF
ncbi:hypothetical protein K450DRAFT_268469 [Umbelopsis ramanniana AG]|uniref:FAD-binding FR-type domain-containing protein n=1 Tax=Umbelopsis ramanniana AG TaxID=1314678 RepID=A0AAD5EJC9_UMBRA|nr:uncharacterized protein K450DRAFT_268469 [Umbelopsis ramanniana AG]KAI8583375.1 hypothetical protein K450DRAFT_268469 [Umbelopsis ramanniana AG]